MNEAPRQLCFGFADDGEHAAVSRTTLYWRARIDRAVRQAFQLGKRQRRPPIPMPPRTLSADVPSLPSRAFQPSLEESNELHAIAGRLARLTVSRTNPHTFFEQRSELVFAIRQIAKRR